MRMGGHLTLSWRSGCLTTELSRSTPRRPTGGDVRATFKLLIEADAEEARIGSEMIALWTRCLTNRLQLERDLGVLDADTWPAFLARFQARPAPTP